MIKWLTILVAIFLIGVELPVAHGREANKRMENREEARRISKQREQQRITEFKKTTEARKLRIRDSHGSAKTLTDAAVAVCDRAAFDAARSVFKKYYERETAWAYSRVAFHKQQADNYKQRLSAADEKINSLKKEHSEAYTIYTREVLNAQISTQIQNTTDLAFKIAAYAEIVYSAESYNSYVHKLYNSIMWTPYPKDCTKETLSHKPKDTGNVPKDEGKHAADDDKRIRADGGGGTPKPRSEEERIVEADEGGMLTGKALRLSDLEGCGAAFLKHDWDEYMGFASTPCPGLTGGRVATKADYLTHCNKFKQPLSYDCGPPGPGTEKMAGQSGIYGMPLPAFCLGLHFNVLASKDGVYNRTVKAGKLASIFKYDNGSRKLECYYVSFAQSKALRDQYKNIGKGSGPARPVAEAKPNKGCKSGVAVALNCVTKQIEGAGTPPDSAPPTIRKGNRRPRRNKDRSPAFASSTDPSTGETITSVGNPDGSRTVTKTDKDGNILSREKVR